MMLFKRIKIRSYETGLYFRDGEFKGLLGEGRHWLFDLLGKVRVDVANMRDAWLAHDKLDMIVKSGALKDRAVVMDLKDHQRGLVWIEGRFSHLLAPGLYAYWHGVARRACRGDRCPPGAVRARGPEGHRASAHGEAAARHLHGRPRPRGCTVHRRTVRRHAAAGSVRVLEGRGGRPGCRDRHARDDDRRQRSGDHDGRQGQPADERAGYVPHRRRAEGGQLDGRRPPGAVPRDAVGAAGHCRRTRTRCVPDRQGRGGSGDRAGSTSPRGRVGSGESYRSVSGT